MQPGCRGLAILGRTELPVFKALLAALVATHARRTLEPRLQRQLFQACQHAQAAGTVSADELPPEHLVRSSAKWWSRGAVTVPSLSLQRMAALVRCHVPTCACPHGRRSCRGDHAVQCSTCCACMPISIVTHKGPYHAGIVILARNGP